MSQSQADTLLRRGITAAKAGQQERAQQYLLRAVELDERNEQAWLWLSGVMERVEDRRICLENVLTINPNNGHARAGLEQLDRLAAPMPRPGAVAPNLCPLCEGNISPSDSFCPHCDQSLYVACPNCAEYVDLDRQHCSHCDQKLGDAHDETEYRYSLGMAYLEHEKPQLALEAWQRVLDIAPTFPGIHLSMAEAYVAQGYLSRAIGHYEKALEADPQNVSLLLKLAAGYRNTGSLSKARDAAQRALAITPRSAAVHFALADIHHEARSYKLAFREYRQALRHDRTHAQAHTHLGQLYEIVGQEDKAIESYRRAVDLAPESAKDARERLAELRPPLPPEIAGSWFETGRQVARVSLLFLAITVIDGGLSLRGVSPGGWLGLFAAVVGSYLVVCATSTPLNFPLLARATGDGRRALRWGTGAIGSVALLLSAGLILLS